jgi:oxygen-independent coproporphyrinogen III oxidase
MSQLCTMIDPKTVQFLPGGIYIHIPFCKQACTYCNFHFVTSLRHKSALLGALDAEIALRAHEWRHHPIQTIYLGGGTPSMLEPKDLDNLFKTLEKHISFANVLEVTIEANPDDMSLENLQFWQNETPINRLSIGVQSFYDSHLVAMNRAHSASESRVCIERAQNAGFTNMSLDLIYGMPDCSDTEWQSNLDMAMGQLAIPHISCYALTVEPNTPLAKSINRKKNPTAWDDIAARHMDMLEAAAQTRGYDWYEVSNLSKPGHESRHNTAYWQGHPYWGLGPAAHSFDGERTRSWQVANNAQYIKSIESGILPAESELLSDSELYNELIMTGLRSKFGVDIPKTIARFGPDITRDIDTVLKRYLSSGSIVVAGDRMYLTHAGRRMADAIAAAFFDVK